MDAPARFSLSTASDTSLREVRPLRTTRTVPSACGRNVQRIGDAFQRRRVDQHIVELSGTRLDHLREARVFQQDGGVCHRRAQRDHIAVGDIGLIDRILQFHLAGQIMGYAGDFSALLMPYFVRISDLRRSQVDQQYPAAQFGQHLPQIDRDKALAFVWNAACDHDRFDLVPAEPQVDAQLIDRLLHIKRQLGQMLDRPNGSYSPPLSRFGAHISGACTALSLFLCMFAAS